MYTQIRVHNQYPKLSVYETQCIFWLRRFVKINFGRQLRTCRIVSEQKLWAQNFINISNVVYMRKYRKPQKIATT